MAIVHTGKKHYNKLIEVYVDNGQPTTNPPTWKLNDKMINGNPNPDYIDDVDDFTMCPLPPIYLLALNILPAGLSNAAIVANPLPSINNLYGPGANVELKALISNKSYQFDSFSGDISTTNNPAIVKMDNNKNITANFTKIKRTITIEGRYKRFINHSYSATPNLPANSWVCWENNLYKSILSCNTLNPYQNNNSVDDNLLYILPFKLISVPGYNLMFDKLEINSDAGTITTRDLDSSDFKTVNNPSNVQSTTKQIEIVINGNMTLKFYYKPK